MTKKSLFALLLSGAMLSSIAVYAMDDPSEFDNNHRSFINKNIPQGPIRSTKTDELRTSDMHVNTTITQFTSGDIEVVETITYPNSNKNGYKRHTRYDSSTKKSFIQGYNIYQNGELGFAVDIARENISPETLLMDY